MNPRKTQETAADAEMRLDYSPSDIVAIGDAGANDPSSEPTRIMRAVDVLALVMEDSSAGF